MFDYNLWKGFIAPKDIVVYKQLKKKDSEWVTSCREWEVSLDSMLTPDEDSPEITKYVHNCEIMGGVIYSYTKTKDTLDDISYFKAIIPEGTRFWIQDDLREVTSERLYLTSERVYEKSEADFSFLYSSYCLDLLLKDGSRISWSPEVSLNDVKGIFVYDSQAIGLDSYGSRLANRVLPDLPGQILRKAEAEEDLSGRERTRYLLENYPNIEVLFDLPKDSYLPSLGELSKALGNSLLINLTRKALGLNIIGHGWFLSSTPYSEECIWCICPYWLEWSTWNDYSWECQWQVLSFIT